MNRKSGFWVALWAALLVVTGFLAFGSAPGSVGYGPWHDWGRMGGMGAGQGGGMPYAMMGRFGAGMHGMGAGMGCGMMESGHAPMPEQFSGLTPEQTQKFNQLQQEAGARNSSLARQLWAARDKLNLLYMSEQRDWNAIRAASQTLFDLRRQQFDAGIELQQKTDGLLSDRQRQEMARSRRDCGWMGAQ